MKFPECALTVLLKYAIIRGAKIWVWRSLVARYLGVVEAVGSSPATQTKKQTPL